MDLYPLDLIFAVAAATATIFLGFLPTRNIRSEFFARQIIPLIFIWALVGLASPGAVRHYHYFVAFFCFASWWQFHRDRALSGKMWLSLASGLGVSLGVMLILAVTPRAYPPALPQLGQGLLLASIYLGGAVIGLAYVGYVLIQGLPDRSGVTLDQVKRYVGLLVGLVLARAAVLLVLIGTTAEISGPTKITTPPLSHTFSIFGRVFSIDGYLRQGGLSLETILLLGLVVIVLPVLAFVARRTIRAGSVSQAASALRGVCVGGLLAEIFARLLVL